MGRDEPIDSALQTSPELREAYERQPEAREIIDTARALEGLRREDSVHAAGVVIGDKPLVNYLPLKLSKDSRDDAKKMVTQFDMNGVAQLGLLKMDFLGLRNLSVIEETLRHLRARGVDLDIDHVPLDDDDTYAMLRRGDTIGVFQMESPGVKNLIKLLEPDRFEDLMACVALYRPGLLSMGQHTEYAERKHGRKKVTYPHPDLEPVLKDTYGIIVYQEQVMQTAVAIAGFSMGEADTLRKVMGKKIREKVAAERDRFVAGAVALGRDQRVAEGIFEYVEPFADYGFNASHACAYGYVAYQTAYLMAHHPVEYMAAILTSVKDDKDRKPYYLYACRGMGIEVLPPDVNESDMDFAPAPGDRRAIRYGLSAVRNVGQGVVQSILEARAAGGAFDSFTDFCRRVEPTSVTKRVLESLIFAGAFGSMGYTRGGMLQQIGEQAAFEKVAAPILSERKAEAAGQFSLFGGGQDTVLEIDESVLDGDELDKRLLLSKEKEMLGQFVTDHPLLGIEDQLKAQTTCQIPDLENRDDGELVVLGGIIGTLARKFTKRGEPYAQFRLEGLTGGVEVVAFPSVYEAVPELIDTDRVVLVAGRIDRRGRELQIRATEVKEPSLVGGGGERVSDILVVDLPAAVCSPGVLAKLKTLLEGSPGDVPVRLRFLSSQGVQPLSLGAFTVSSQGSLLDELRHLLGPSAARLEHEPV
jgi:DNA polymerase-3 subunit alpha